MSAISEVAHKILATEAKDILSRIANAAAHEVAVLKAQFTERLAHLASHLGEEAFKAIENLVADEAKPPQMSPSTPEAGPTKPRK